MDEEGHVGLIETIFRVKQRPETQWSTPLVSEIIGSFRN